MTRYKYTEADKTNKIKKHPALTDEQKDEFIEFFKTHNDQHNLIDWNIFNRMNYEQIHTIIENWEKTHLLPKATLKDLKEGTDYDYIGKDGGYDYYFIYTYRASVAFASNNIGPEVWSPLCEWYISNYAGEKTKWEENVLYDYPQKGDDSTPFNSVTYGGAKWCISMNHTAKFWNQYTSDKGYNFVFAIRDSYSNNTQRNKYAIELKGSSVQETYNSWDKNSSSAVTDFLRYNAEAKNRLEKYSAKSEGIKKKEIKQKEINEFKKRTEGLEIKNLTYKGYDFPMVEMGVRPEGKVFGSYYLITDWVPFSPKYNGEKYKYGCNQWSTSIVRQWLNSDEPAGQWYKEYEVDNDKVDWSNTPSSTKNFIKNTDGFLRIVGLDKSQLNPVKNITYTTKGKEIITEDYIWIPSLTELSTQNKYIEGQPLEYWQKLLGNNASQSSNENRIMKSCDTFESAWYWIRSADSDCSYDVRSVASDGDVIWDSAYDAKRLPVLACFKS